MTNVNVHMFPNGWETELLDRVSACQSAYHIDNTPEHRFGGLGSNLEENRSELICFVRGLIESHTDAAVKTALASPEVQTWKKDSERLDWIQEQAKQSRSGVGFDWRPDYAEEGQVLEMKGWRFMRHHFLGVRKPSIREAIDAAMEK